MARRQPMVIMVGQRFNILVSLFMVCIGVSGTGAQWVDHKRCGKSKYTDAGEQLALLSRIVGGADTREYEFPYQARLCLPPPVEHFCGAALIDRMWVLTAAHCVSGGWWHHWGVTDLQGDMRIRLGEHNVTNPPDYVKTRKADLIVVHENYNQTSGINDMALIKMDSKTGWEKGRIRTICKPDPDDTYTGRRAIASGWGSVQFGGHLADVLQYAPLVVVENEDCRQRYLEVASEVTDSMLCASDGATGHTRDACQGDSGGPLAVKNKNGRFELVGLTSWGYGCAAGFPGVYTRVGDYVDWISYQMERNAD